MHSTYHATAKRQLAACGNRLLLLNVTGLITLHGVEGRLATLVEEGIAGLTDRWASNRSVAEHRGQERQAEGQESSRCVHFDKLEAAKKAAESKQR